MTFQTTLPQWLARIEVVPQQVYRVNSAELRVNSMIFIFFFLHKNSMNFKTMFILQFFSKPTNYVWNFVNQYILKV